MSEQEDQPLPLSDDRTLPEDTLGALDDPLFSRLPLHHQVTTLLNAVNISYQRDAKAGLLDDLQMLTVRTSQFILL